MMLCTSIELKRLFFKVEYFERAILVIVLPVLINNSMSTNFIFLIFLSLEIEVPN